MLEAEEADVGDEAFEGLVDVGDDLGGEVEGVGLAGEDEGVRAGVEGDGEGMG